ncbi:MAG: cohesin domain-containing protein [Acidobacteriota bacterium]
MTGRLAARSVSRLAIAVFGLLPALQGAVISVGSATAPAMTVFSIPVLVSQVSDLYSFEFDFSFDPAVLQAIGVREGPFLSSSGATFFLAGQIDNRAGLIAFTADTLSGAVPGASGAGILTWIDLYTSRTGRSQLLLSNVVLLDSALEDSPFTLQAGEAVVSAAAPEPATLTTVAALAICCLPLCRRRSEDAAEALELRLL